MTRILPAARAATMLGVILAEWAMALFTVGGALILAAWLASRALG
ncbi:hypothetical protein [Rubellimicrobium arenae]|nr:hypothetical protein [Rubellimicrobium arenae]